MAIVLLTGCAQPLANAPADSSGQFIAASPSLWTTPPDAASPIPTDASRLPAVPATAPASPTPIVQATPTLSQCSAGDVLASWPLERLAEQTIVVPVDERNVAAVQAEVSAGAGGILLFGTSAPSDLGTQLHALETFAPGGVAPFVMTDEEGGAVQRMANIVGFIPSAR